MHQNNDPNSSSYYQYYQSHFRNLNPQSNPSSSDPIPYAAVSASAPLVIPNYSPSGYPQYSDHVRNHLPHSDYVPSHHPLSDLSPRLYSFPHLNSQYYPPYDHDKQVSLNFDCTPGSKLDLNLAFSNYGGYDDQGLYGEGVYAYSGGNKVPYGAHGTGSGSGALSRVLFDDYGRPVGAASGEKQNGLGSMVVRAVPKAEVDHNVAGGAQKFRARLLSEGAGQSDIDVLCQIGLDGIRVLDPATSRTLKIYSLDNVTRWEVLDSYIFAFWAKTSIDVEPKRIRLKSNSYTSNNMLDMVAATSFQLKEIGETKKPSDAVNVAEQASEKKKGFPDWINLMKPRNEEKDYWVPDEAVSRCSSCGTDFNAFVRRHHCRNCGDIFCDKCTQGRIELTTDENAAPVRVCDHCMAEVTQRLTNAKESAGNVATLQSHTDLAKKIKEEMDKNQKTSTGFALSGPGVRMEEVACPTCTVHLQVQVPSSGSETIECSVCQHPFLVRA